MTSILIADLGIAKTITGEPTLTELGNFVVTYQIVVQNTGTVDLADLSLLEDLSTQFGAAFVEAGNATLTSSPESTGSSIAAATSSFNGGPETQLLDTSASNILAVGDSFTLEFDVEIDPRAVADSVGNQVAGSGTAVDENGTPLLNSSGNQLVANDLSDSGTDPSSANPDNPSDNGTSDDVSQFTLPTVPLSEISGVVFLDENGNGIADLGERGIEGVEVTLTGQDVLGASVSIVTFTDASGQYVFSGLNAGTYALEQTQPSEFSDGLETGEANSTVGNDVISNIELGFGETLNSSRFGERLSGTSGFPPSFPNIAPAFSLLISNLINGYLGGPGPIYSGVPVSSNANPLSLDSNREVAGGFVLSPEQEVVDCGCAEPTDQCGDSVDSVVESTVPAIEEMVENYCPEQSEISGEPVEESSPACLAEMLVSTEELCEADSSIDDQECDSPRRPFLKRFTNWLSR